MTSATQQIRDRVVTLLTGLTTTGNNVAGFRVYSVDEAALPHLSIITEPESRDEDRYVLDGKDYQDLTILVEARAKKTAAMDDQLDQIALEVERALTADKTLGIGIKDISLINTTTELDDAAEKPTGLLTMTWLAEYRIDESDAETIIQ